MTVAAFVVWQTRFGENTPRRRKTRNSASWIFVPANVERCELRKELKLGVRQMIMYPPCHRLPRYILVQAINQPRHNDGGHRTHTTILAALVPNVAGAITLI